MHQENYFLDVINNKNRHSIKLKNLLFPGFYIFTAITILGLIQLLFHALSSYSLTLDWSAIISIPNLVAVERYRDVLVYPSRIKFALYCLYPASLLGGFLYVMNKENKKLRVLMLLPIFCAITLGLLEAARASILLSSILYFSALSAGYVYLNLQQKRIFGKGFFITSTVIAILFTGFFILIQWLRQAGDSLITTLLIERLQSYYFGYLAAFTNWLSDYYTSLPTLGMTTFAGPSNLSGLMERPLGFYDPVMISTGLETNIFTAFRGIIYDFSIPGSLVISFFTGFLGSIVYMKANSGKFLAMILLSMIYAFIFYSPLISIFHYNSILISWLIAFIIFIINKKKSKYASTYLAYHR